MGLNRNIITKSEQAKNEILNKIFVTNEGYEVLVTDYINRHLIYIEFQDNNKYKTITTKQNMLKGQIKNPFHKTVYGIGYYGDGEYTARVNNKKTVEYIKWFSMFNRCYDPKYHALQPKYKGCTVDESFHNFQDFAKWFNQNWYDCDYPLELDKDLIKEGNKVYSSSNCCLIPKEINTALVYKRHDKKHMVKIYNKYKDIVPSSINKELLIIITT